MEAWAVGAPKNTPAEIIDQLNRETNAALAHSKLKARVADPGGMVFPLSPAEYEKRVAEETEGIEPGSRLSIATGSLQRRNSTAAEINGTDHPAGTTSFLVSGCACCLTDITQISAVGPLNIELDILFACGQNDGSR